MTKLAVAVLAAVLVLPLMAVVLIGGAIFGGGGSSGSTATTGFTVSLGPPVDLGPISPPAAIVAVDEAVAAAKPPMEPCQPPASLLLAQQHAESGFNPLAVSPTGAEGLAQFEPGTFPSYDTPAPPGGANPPTPFNPVDAAYAEGRYLCGLLSLEGSWEGALYAYNCGPAGSSPSCTTYALGILEVAARLSTPPTTTQP